MPGKEDKGRILFFCVIYFIIIIIIHPGTVKTEWELIDYPIDSLQGCVDSTAK